MAINIDFFVCPSCKSEQFERTDLHMTCTNCEIQYPIIDGTIPVLVSNPAQLITQTYQQYGQYLRTQKNENLALKNANHPFRDPVETEKLISAKEHNAAVLASLKNALKPFVDPDQLTSTQGTNDFRYLVNWEYLRRDWANEKTGEHEIATILEHITKEVSSEQRNGSAVILGAGAGRLVNELSESHVSVFALDNMFTMVGLYHEVLRNDVHFYEINEKNILRNTDRCVEKVAKKPTQKLNVRPENYFWGDASKLPFAKESLSRVYSVYFTDVLPLTVLLKEVDRVLKPGGDFVHFGPLFYHFNHSSDMLSAEEVARAFEANGFEIVLNTTSELSHHKSDVSMMHRVYTNWSFIARKRQIAQAVIDDDTIYAIDKGLKYSAQGEISEKARELDFDLEMTLPDGTKYATTDLILEAIRRADGERNFAQIIRTIEEEYGQVLQEEDTNELKEILLTLIDKGVIKIVD